MNKKSRTVPGESTPSGRQSREAILEAALRTFARDGFDGASMLKIAQLAEVAPPLIHYYFKSKDNLWRETVNNSLGVLCQEVGAIVAATRPLAPLDRLRALLQQLTLFAARCPDQFVMIIADARSDSDRFEWIKNNYTNIFLDHITAILDDAIGKDVIRQIDVKQLSFMLMGSILLYFTLNQNFENEAQIDAEVNRYTDTMADIFLNGVIKTRLT